MGAWSHEPFGNDTAADWAWGLAETEDFSHIEAALDKVLDSGADFVEAPDAEEAIAAIEVIAKLLGKGTQSDSYTEEVDQWVAKMSARPDSALIGKAQRVLARILAKDSELLELWKESESFNDWKETIGHLQKVLGG